MRHLPGIRTRPATPADAAAIAEIYNQGIAERIATFETEPRTPAQIAAWLKPGHLIVVAETDAVGPVAFAASFAYGPRPCYAGIGEFSVYVRREHRGRGAGRAVLAALIEAAAARGMHKLTSRVFPENVASRALLKGLVSRKSGFIGAMDNRMAAGVTVWSSSGCWIRALARADSETPHRSRRPWDGADARLGIELLPAGNPGRSDRAGP